MPQVRELRVNLTSVTAAAAKAQLQSEGAHADLTKLQSQHSALQAQANRTAALEAELAELRLQLRSAQTLAAQQQQEAMLSRGVSWNMDGGEVGTDSNGGSTPLFLSPRPSFSARQGGTASRRGSGGSPLNPRLSITGMQVHMLAPTLSYPVCYSLMLIPDAKQVGMSAF